MDDCVCGEGPLALGPAFDEVLAAAAAGAPWAFERLYHDLAPAVAGYLRLQGGTEPEDLTSEVFIGVFSGLRSFTGTEQQFRSWVFTITHRRLLDERRRLSRRRWFLTDEPTVLDPQAGNAEHDALESIEEQRVRELCSSLAPDQREVLLLRILGDLTVEQVARVVGKSVGAVKALQRRGLTQLRKKVQPEGVPL